MKIQVTVIFLVGTVMLSACSAQATPAALTATPLPTSTTFPTLTAYPTAEHFEFSMLSPDGTKKIQSRDWETFDILDIKSNKALWSFSYDRAKFGKDDMYLWEAGYGIDYWSTDGRYIYVSAHQGWDGGVKYYGDVFGAVEGLARFDVDTGVMTEVLAERYGGGYTFAISPDENSLVYVDQRETPLVLRWRDLLTNTEKTLLTFDKEILDVGVFGWSPKMEKMIFMGLEVQNPGHTDGSQKFFYSIFAMDLKNSQLYRAIQGFDRSLEFRSWNEQDQVFYTDWENTIWQLELESNTLAAKGTATPDP